MTDATLAVRYTERVGAVDRIFSLLRRREFPVGGITLERTHQPGIGRMTVMVSEPEAVTQITRHLSKLADVVEVEAGQGDAVRREYALARISCMPQQRAEVMPILAAFKATPLGVESEHLVLEASGSGDHLDSLFAALTPYGIEELARTSPLAIARRQ